MTSNLDFLPSHQKSLSMVTKLLLMFSLKKLPRWQCVTSADYCPATASHCPNTALTMFMQFDNLHSQITECKYHEWESFEIRRQRSNTPPKSFPALHRHVVIRLNTFTPATPAFREHGVKEFPKQDRAENYCGRGFPGIPKVAAYINSA